MRFNDSWKNLTSPVIQIFIYFSKCSFIFSNQRWKPLNKFLGKLSFQVCWKNNNIFEVVKIIITTHRAIYSINGSIKKLSDWVMKEWDIEWVNEEVSKWFNEGVREWVVEWRSEAMSGQMNKRDSKWLYDWVRQWMGEQRIETVRGWMKEWASEWVNEEVWVSGWNKEWGNEWLNKRIR